MNVINAERLTEHLGDYATLFRIAEPFPHVVMEDFLYPTAAEDILAQYPALEDIVWDDSKTYKHQQGKYQKGALDGSPIKPFFDETASLEFRQLMSELTGVNGLEADPDLFGAGLHQIQAGGYLDVHVDFNLHPKTRQYRRLNLLVYLNRDWKPEYEGSLELWDMQQSRRVKTILPSFNRAVLFETSEVSFHGHPRPLNPPVGKTRKSLSVYYYTPEIGPNIAAAEHNTIYKNTEGLAGAMRVSKSALIATIERTTKRTKPS